MNIDSHGYNTDFACYDNFFAQLNPHWIRYTAATHGKAVSFHDDFTYCDIGCGHGLTSAITAASNPKAQVYGIDFQQAHKESMEQYKRLLKADNFHPIQGDLLNLPELPQMDFIIAHGFISWVSSEVTDGLFEFIRTHLKPGGLVLISYDSLPGCAHREQLAQIFRRHIDSAETTADGIEQAMHYLAWLSNHKSRLFDTMPLFASDMMSLGNVTAIAQKYANGFYKGFHFEDVNEKMNDAGLLFAGQTDGTLNLRTLSISSDVLNDLSGSKIQQEITCREILCLPFASDVFHKPSNEDGVKVDDIYMTNALPLSNMGSSITTPLGEIEIDEKVARRIFEWWEKPQRFRDIEVESSTLHILTAINQYVLPVANPQGRTKADLKEFLDVYLRNSNAPFIPFPSRVLGAGVGIPSEIACVILAGNIDKGIKLAAEMDKDWKTLVVKELAPRVKQAKELLRRVGAIKRR